MAERTTTKHDIQRDEVNVSRPNYSVVNRISVTGNIAMTYDGVDPGTGHVTLMVTGTGGSFDLGAGIHDATTRTFGNTDELPFWDAASGLLGKMTGSSLLSYIAGTFLLIVDFIAAGLPIVDSGDYFSSIEVEGALQELGSSRKNGWIPRSETWTRTGNHTFMVSGSGDLTATFRKGTKILYQDGGGNEYGVVGSSSFATAMTTVNLIPNSDYAMAAATITNKNISYIENPEGFPVSFNYTSVHSRTGTDYTNLPTVTISTWSPVGPGQLRFAQVWQQHATPGGTGNQQFTVPLTSLTVLLGTAYNASTAVMQMPQIATSTNLCVLTRYDGTTEVTATAFYVAGGIIDY